MRNQWHSRSRAQSDTDIFSSTETVGSGDGAQDHVDKRSEKT